jgi:23S rRNA pseudouridine2605 synthase
MRVAKVRAHAGVASRRAAEQLVFAGRVTVGGDVVRDPARDVGEGDVVAVDGRGVSLERRHVVYALNKPAGYVSTAKDPQGRPTVVSLIDSRERLYPVGRLDADTTGLLLLTNDGELAHRLTHPSFEVPRVYRVQVRNAPIREPALRRLREGVLLDDGKTAPAAVRRLTPDRLEIVLHEGRKRQVRRMCEAVGHRVAALERIAFGPLRLGDLPLGRHRLLKAAEVELLRRAAEAPPRAGGAGHPRGGPAAGAKPRAGGAKHRGAAGRRRARR